MLILIYASKKDLKAAVRQPLNAVDPSPFSKGIAADGKVYGSNRPSINPRIPKGSREFFAEVTMTGGLIAKVS